MTQKDTITDNRQEIQALDLQIHQRRQQLDELISRSGRLQQSLTQIDALKVQYQDTGKQLQEYEKQHRIYNELTQAFGKNGIQALTIENILPQLEAETNQILARLTGNQFHVQFLTQKATKGTSKKKTKTNRYFRYCHCRCWRYSSLRNLFWWRSISDKFFCQAGISQTSSSKIGNRFTNADCR